MNNEQIRYLKSMVIRLALFQDNIGCEEVQMVISDRPSEDVYGVCKYYVRQANDSLSFMGVDEQYFWSVEEFMEHFDIVSEMKMEI